MLTFCGSEVNVSFDINGISGKECFKRFENGYYKDKEIITRHSNVVRSVIIGKKSWGLWVGEWTDGIVEGSFTKHEILNEFEGINMPENLIKEFNNRIKQKIIKRYENKSK